MSVLDNSIMISGLFCPRFCNKWSIRSVPKRFFQKAIPSVFSGISKHSHEKHPRSKLDWKEKYTRLDYSIVSIEAELQPPFPAVIHIRCYSPFSFSVVLQAEPIKIYPSDKLILYCTKILTTQWKPLENKHGLSFSCTFLNLLLL